MASRISSARPVNVTPVLDVVEKTRDFTPLCQRFQISENHFQFPGKHTSGSNVDLDNVYINL